jgi:hypothetical protein
MPFAVHSMHVRAVEIDHELSYSIVDDGPRFVVTPIDTGTGPAIFPEFEEAETWRLARLAEVMETQHGA